MADPKYSGYNPEKVIDLSSRRKSGDPPPPGDGELEARVIRVESDLKEIKGDLKTLLRETAEINGRVQMMPSAAAFGELKGRVDVLPTTTKIAALLAIAVAILTIIGKWPDLIRFISPQ